MSATENKRSVIVAVFVLIGIIIFIAGVFILGGQQRRFQKTFELKAIFDDVQGLRRGNNVWFSGVKVGTVRGINFYGKSQVEITMRIEEEAQKYIRKDSRVRISSEGLIGNRILEIFGGSTETPTAQSGDLLDAEQPLDTENMLATLQENNKNLVQITNDFRELSSKMVKGEGTVGALLTDQQIADNFREAIADLQNITANTVRASSALTSFAAKLNTEGGLANELLTDTVVFNQLRASVEQLQLTASSAQELTENLNEASNRLNSPDNPVGVILNDEEMAGQLRSTMNSLESGIERFDQNMEALQHNFLFRGFFRRRARQEARTQDQAAGEQQNQITNQNQARDR